MGNTTSQSGNVLRHYGEKEYLIDPGHIITAGQSVVYKAQDIELGREVCIKRITVTGNSRLEKRQNYDRARAEIKPLILIGEKGFNVPRVYDCWYDEEQGNLYIVMQWVQGQSLEDKLTSKVRIQETQFLQWIIELCSILSEMERLHLYHKDIKPANLIIDNRNQLWLIDFGISLSASNLVEGTPSYRAPEMERDSRYPGREKVDMFAIGVILYQYYTGRIPQKPDDYVKGSRFGPNVWSTFHEPRETNSEMSKTMNYVIVRCMAYAPQDRYSNIKDLRYSLVKVMKEKKSWQNQRKTQRTNHSPMKKQSSGNLSQNS